MPDHRRHRGAHPRDRELFAETCWAALAAATRDYAWLVSRGYAPVATLQLVGNRYSLVERQRAAIARVACSDAVRQRRRANVLLPVELAGRALAVDGFNVIIALEVALGGGIGLIGLDGARRDLASVHGTYRRVLETPRAVELALTALEQARPSALTWYLDRPVSNSGKLAGLLRQRCAGLGTAWTVELVDDADRAVSQAGVVALSADGGVIDAAERWFDLAGHVVAQHLPEAWTLDFSGLDPA
jgi:hypothetical protein